MRVFDSVCVYVCLCLCVCVCVCLSPSLSLFSPAVGNNPVLVTTGSTYTTGGPLVWGYVVMGPNVPPTPLETNLTSIEDIQAAGNLVMLSGMGHRELHYYNPNVAKFTRIGEVEIMNGVHLPSGEQVYYADCTLRADDVTCLSTASGTTSMMQPVLLKFAVHVDVDASEVVSGSVTFVSAHLLPSPPMDDMGMTASSLGNMMKWVDNCFTAFDTMSTHASVHKYCETTPGEYAHVAAKTFDYMTAQVVRRTRGSFVCLCCCQAAMV